MTAQQLDVIVAGGGPAGLSTALMLGRAGRRVLVVDSEQPRNRFATHMHGVLGYEGRPPTDLTARGRHEIAQYGVELRNGRISAVEDDVDNLRVQLDDGTTYATRALAVATGLVDSLPDIPGLAERWGTTVLHCPYCHGHEVRDRRLGVLAGNPTGLMFAELIRQWSDDVVVFADTDVDSATRHRLATRGVRIVQQPVVAIEGPGTSMTGVRTADGTTVGIDALFMHATPLPNDGFLAGLSVRRQETPMGSFLEVDPMGLTSHPRVWAVGNIVNPAANVPMSIGQGASTGGAINFALARAEFDHAALNSSGLNHTDPGHTEPGHAHPGHRSGSEQPDTDQDPAAFWNELYSDTRWSGDVNAALADAVGDLTGVTALDLGSGEGADAIWLAGRGWRTTGVDISATAVRRAQQAAASAGLDAEQLQFVVNDLTTWRSDERFDLVTASFLHSPVRLHRTEILRRAADQVTPGGHLLIVGHAAPPPWAGDEHGGDEHAHDDDARADLRFRTAAQEIAELDLDDAAWSIVIAEDRERSVTAPDGAPAALRDAVVLLRRRA